MRAVLESVLQRAVANALEGLRLQGKISSTHVANEFPAKGRAAMIQVRHLKEQGMRPGVADNLVFLPGGRVIHIELKRSRNMETPAQIEVREELEALGHECHVVTASLPHEAANAVEAIVLRALGARDGR